MCLAGEQWRFGCAFGVALPAAVYSCYAARHCLGTVMLVVAEVWVAIFTWASVSRVCCLRAWVRLSAA
jgi:hypothetical protein